ncbi:hypothetical protein KY285_013210 [Solanum tuberosum]|nr:hypothetical protein KY285_013210 [Solanum tuberosum]
MNYESPVNFYLSGSPFSPVTSATAVRIRFPVVSDLSDVPTWACYHPQARADKITLKAVVGIRHTPIRELDLCSEI